MVIVRTTAVTASAVPGLRPDAVAVRRRSLRPDARACCPQPLGRGSPGHRG